MYKVIFQTEKYLLDEVGWLVSLFNGISTFGWLVGSFLWHINLCRLFNAKSIFIQIVSSISNNSVQLKYAVSMSKQFYFK